MFWENYVKLCTKEGKSPNAVASELNLSSATVTKWKNGSIPRDSTLQIIADHFEVPVATLKIAGAGFQDGPKKYGLKAARRNSTALKATGVKLVPVHTHQINASDEEEIFLSYFRTLSENEKKEIIAKMAVMSAKKRFSKFKP